MDFVEDDELYEHFRIEVDKGQVPVRIDKYLSEHQPHSSRNRIQKAADAGFIHVNGRPVKSNYKVRAGDIVTLMLDRPHYDTTIEPEDIPLDQQAGGYGGTSGLWQFQRYTGECHRLASEGSGDL